MRKILTLAIISLLLLSTFSILVPQVKAEGLNKRTGQNLEEGGSPTAEELAAAILTPSTAPFLVSATKTGVAGQFEVYTIPLQGFPTDGPSWALISTGKASNIAGEATIFYSYNTGGPTSPPYSHRGYPSYDIATLSLELSVPPGATTLSFDWRFGTEENPTYIGQYVDWASAIITTSAGSTNILLLPDGKPVDVDNAVPFSNQVTGTSENPLPPYPEPNDVVYNAMTGMYKATFDVAPFVGETVRIDFQIADENDQILDSALFIDNLHIETGITPELVFQAPYTLGTPFGSSSSFPPLLTKAEFKSEVQPDQGTGYTYVDVVVSVAGEGDAVAGFTLEDWWISNWSGTANIAASFDITGLLKAIGASQEPFGYSLLGIGLKASLTVRDVTTSQDVFHEEKLIFEEEMEWEWKDVFIPLTYSSPTYENTEYLIQGFIEIEEGHRYLWRFETRVWTMIVTAGLGTGVTMADITTELVDVRVGPPVLKPEPEPITTTESDMIAAVFSPINMLIIDPAGRRIGFDFNTQQEVNEIPGAWYGGPDYVPQLVRIPTPTAGDYDVLLFGISTGSYTAIIVGTEDLTGGEVFTGDIVEGAIYAYTTTITETMVTSQPNPASELGYLKDYILGLPAEVFRGQADNRKNALSNKIDEVILKVESGQYVDAINKLRRDIRARMDGDSTAQDWIIGPVTQLDLSAIIDHIILNIEML